MDTHAIRGLRIAHVTPYFWPVIGGITTYVDSIASAQRDMGAQVRIYAKAAKFGNHVQVGPSNPFLFSQWAARQLLGWRPAVVHAHGEWSSLAASQLPWGAIAPKTIFTVHTDFVRPKNPIREALLRRLLGRADVVTAMSQASLDALSKRFPNVRKLEVTPPGCRMLDEDHATTQSLLTALKLRDCFPRICSVSMMVWPEKVRGLKLMVQSMSEVVREFPSAKLVIVGDGNLRHELEQQIDSSGVRASVVLVGQRENPAPFIAASDIFAHISFRDVFPQALLEALSIGKPAIVNREIARNLPAKLLSGAILEVGATTRDIAEATKRLCSDEGLRQSLARTGQVTVRREFSWDRIASDMMTTYGLRL